jgi:hypothetical protein
MRTDLHDKNPFIVLQRRGFRTTSVADAKLQRQKVPLDLTDFPVEAIREETPTNAHADRPFSIQCMINPRTPEGVPRRG